MHVCPSVFGGVVLYNVGGRPGSCMFARTNTPIGVACVALSVTKEGESCSEDKECRSGTNCVENSQGSKKCCE